MARKSERGTVLVASMVVLALLSLLGAGSLLNATIDTQMAANQRVGKEAFYAAEAALEVGVGRIMSSFRDQLQPFVPGTAVNWTAPSTAAFDPIGSTSLPGHTLEFRVTNALNNLAPATEPQPFPYSTTDNGQEIIHFAYTYNVEGRAVSANGAETVSETVRALETPLVQYFVFFDDDLSWHPDQAMNSWGRVHTNGNLYFAPTQPVWFRDYDDNGNLAPCSLTVHRDVYVDDYLAQAAAGTLNQSSSPVYVRVRNLGIPGGGVPAANPPTTDAEDVATASGINAANKGIEELRFVDSDGVYHLRVNVDTVPSASFRTLDRGGYYEQAADDPTRERVDAIKITADAGMLQVFLTPNGGTTVNVTNLVRDYEVAAGVPVNDPAAPWPVGAMRAGSTDGPAGTGNPRSATAVFDPVIHPDAFGTVVLAPGSMVYSPEDPVTHDDLGNEPYNGSRASLGHTPNPDYPCVIETKDGREGRDVDFTVIDVQRLQLWYRDYMDYHDASPGIDASFDPGQHRLLLYATRTLPNGLPASGSGSGALQAIKLIGSRAGRGRSADNVTDPAQDRQVSPTFVVNTTIVSDNPVYFDGDFNAPGATAGSSLPGNRGSAVVADAAILLSNNWSEEADVYGQTGGAFANGSYAAAPTAYNTALFVGRYDFRLGGGGEEAGIHNLPRFNETWGAANTCSITGCLINLWFSRQAVAPHVPGNYFLAPTRSLGWDVSFANPDYWPPYVPSSYSIDRTAWREN